jgi:hypothetical protein
MIKQKVMSTGFAQLLANATGHVVAACSIAFLGLAMEKFFPAAFEHSEERLSALLALFAGWIRNP